MKRVEIDLNEFLSIREEERRTFIESKLKEAGFDMNKHIVSAVDAPNMKYIYIQDGK
jgi:hypothetical protein